MSKCLSATASTRVIKSQIQNNIFIKYNFDNARRVSFLYNDTIHANTNTLTFNRYPFSNIARRSNLFNPQTNDTTHVMPYAYE